jgi:hypothetical protein
MAAAATMGESDGPKYGSRTPARVNHGVVQR